MHQTKGRIPTSYPCPQVQEDEFGGMYGTVTVLQFVTFSSPEHGGGRKSLGY
jgi:hypothetical protein